MGATIALVAAKIEALRVAWETPETLVINTLYTNHTLLTTLYRCIRARAGQKSLHPDASAILSLLEGEPR